jgi:hypothetical protein
MNDIKTLIVVSLSSLATYLSPISGVVFAVTLVFIANFLFGLIVAKGVSGEDFSFRKAFQCIREAAVFFAVVACTYTIGEHLSNPEGALWSISVITYALLYFYAVNIFKNLKRMSPESRWIAFTYYIISIEFVKKVSFLESYLKQRKEVPDGEA